MKIQAPIETGRLDGIETSRVAYQPVEEWEGEAPAEPRMLKTRLGRSLALPENSFSTVCYR